MRTMVDVRCSECGTITQKPLSEITRQIAKGRHDFFCNLSCAATFTNKPRKSVVISKVCPNCGSTFESTTHNKAANFCSPSCASKGSFTARRLAGNAKGGRATGPKNLIPTDETLRLREAWKYERLTTLLNANKVEYQFESRLNNGHYVFDLLLYTFKIAVEFDGKDHLSPAQQALDAAKDTFAYHEGWTVQRIPVKSATVIPPETLYGILFYRDVFDNVHEGA